MIVERLKFGEQIGYDAEEASIHIARYQIAKNFVKGKRVLDIACGEGYGSYLLKDWGAKAVVGVDISPDSIEVANKYFKKEDITFLCADAQSVFFEEKFELIICLETIEHVKDANLFLSTLKSILAPNGCIIISCPNDHWYYNDNEQNPFHLRKYTFSEFKDLTTAVLGNSQIFGVASNVMGFANFTLAKNFLSVDKSLQASSMYDIVFSKEMNALISKNCASDLPNTENCLYYFGIWDYGEELQKDIILGCNIFPHLIKAKISNLDEYKLAFNKSEVMIKDRDETIIAMEKLIQDYKLAFNKGEVMIKDRDEAIIAMEKLIQERDNYIEELLKISKNGIGKEIYSVESNHILNIEDGKLSSLVEGSFRNIEEPLENYRLATTSGLLKKAKSKLKQFKVKFFG